MRDDDGHLACRAEEEPTNIVDLRTDGFPSLQLVSNQPLES